MQLSCTTHVDEEGLAQSISEIRALARLEEAVSWQEYEYHIGPLPQFRELPAAGQGTF